LSDKEKQRANRRHRWAVIFGFVALVFLQRGIWDMTAEVLTPFMTLIVGLIFVGIVGLIEREQLRKLF
jgi:hypothetical protein